MGNNNIFEGVLARFGKISMEFLHLGGQQGNHCKIWGNLNGVPSLGGFQGNQTVVSKEINEINCMGFQLGKINPWGTMDKWVSAEQIWENLEKSSVLILSKGNNDKICPVLVWSMSDLRG